MSLEPPAPEPARISVELNGVRTELEEGCSVAALVATLAHDSRGIAVALNGEVLAHRVWDSTTLRRLDRVEVLEIAQGGC
jgi:thiamine biosynthesis protein ThiS